MGLIDDYPHLCKSRATNAAYPLDLLDSIQREFQKGLDGGVVSTAYLRSKLAELDRFVTFLEQNADPLQ